MLTLFLPAMAIFLHVLFCEWYDFRRVNCYFEMGDLRLGPDPILGEKAFLASAILGIVLPVALFGLAGFLYLGWDKGIGSGEQETRQ